MHNMKGIRIVPAYQTSDGKTHNTLIDATLHRLTFRDKLFHHKRELKDLVHRQKEDKKKLKLLKHFPTAITAQIQSTIAIRKYLITNCHNIINILKGYLRDV